MSWWKNQKARHEAKKRGEARPRTGGLGDKMSDALESTIEKSQSNVEQLEQARAEHGDGVEGYRAYREQKKSSA